ncbi:polysaccharide pyruvyl transferase CsaB [Peptoniphilus equinus]|uniref:Polysaccharide pyruvyl transferase CsaB n=1 Tax=Peptoniphilus equinus TaxID=3016343 RepID=A0ABY7QUL0_9FIRM|nr:polysaccharide pyruvyl transferase CsaB [Peptoniphilus equinus]WBW50462.1 polysaccharide pyruvyl transferase CsaB [Peptoniphilus equinus]
MPKKILVSGYYGYNNIGDEGILKGLVDGIRSVSDAEITVLSKNPDWTEEKYGVKAVNRSNLKDIFTAMRQTDLVLSGGGSLLQDVSSKKSIIYYLGVLKLAQFLGKKTFIYSQGIGPINTTVNRAMAKSILKKVSYLNVRDRHSEAYLRDLGIDRHVLVTIDTVFGIETPDLNRGREILESVGLTNGKQTVGLIIMNWKHSKTRTIREVVRAVRQIRKHSDVNIVLIPFFYHVDLEIERMIFDELEGMEDLYIVEEYLHVMEYLSLIGNLDVCVSMRLHGLIFSVLMKVYPIGISYDPKIDGFMNELGRVQKHYVQNFTAESVAEDVLDALAHLEPLRADVCRHREHFMNLAKLHNKKVKEVLESSWRK